MLCLTIKNCNLAMISVHGTLCEFKSKFHSLISGISQFKKFIFICKCSAFHSNSIIINVLHIFTGVPLDTLHLRRVCRRHFRNEFLREYVRGTHLTKNAIPTEHIIANSNFLPPLPDGKHTIFSCSYFTFIAFFQKEVGLNAPANEVRPDERKISRETESVAAATGILELASQEPAQHESPSQESASQKPINPLSYTM